MDELLGTLIPHLAGQFERGLPVLFSGAGLSLGANNISGEPVASGSEIRDALWKLCFPGKPLDQGSSLQHLFAHAQLRHRKELAELLLQVLSVDPDSLPEYYRTLFGMSWHRCYTLNIDDLEVATGRRYPLPRAIFPISATASLTPGLTSVDISQHLEVVHLNGTLQDIPDNVTFSPTQYAERLARPEPWYVSFVADLLSHSVVFIGTQLDEPPLWQHLELRKLRGGYGARELRPRSYLVTPALDVARQALLAEFNVFWVPMTAEQFITQILAQLEKPSIAGLQSLQRASAARQGSTRQIPEVSSLSRSPMQSSEFLLGQEPIWADLQSGRAIERESDAEIWEVISTALQKETRAILVVTGTAGSGKSTALMRLCLRLAAEGRGVAWIDRDSEFSPRDIRNSMRADGAPLILAVDDADLFGAELSHVVREVSSSKTQHFVLLGIRSGKVDRALDSTLLKGIPYYEIAIPHLTDADIGKLLDVLDRENRLGILKGKSRSDQEMMFRSQAGRQLLVAMIQATSGAPFKEKAIEEFGDLPPEGRHVYALVAVASAFRFKLAKEEILVASGDQTNASLNVLDQLIRRHVVTYIAGDNSVRARHRVIADLLLDELKKTGELRDVLDGLAFAFATKVGPNMRRSARAWRILRALLNHDFLARSIYPEAARNLYGNLESLLSWDSHYWLQRGSLEVEFGDAALAENFLNQARGLAPDDPFVQTEWGYLLFKKALDHPASIEAPALVEEATLLLEDLIGRTGVADSYPYHVLGSQGLSWVRRGIHVRSDKERFLARLVGILNEACARFPRAAELQQLLKDLTRESLILVTVDRNADVSSMELFPEKSPDTQN